jgi:hypothetical protein
MTIAADATDLRGAKASVDAWIALRVTCAAAKASEVILAERVRRDTFENTGMTNGKIEGGEGYPTRHEVLGLLTGPVIDGFTAPVIRYPYRPVSPLNQTFDSTELAVPYAVIPVKNTAVSRGV